MSKIFPSIKGGHYVKKSNRVKKDIEIYKDYQQFVLCEAKIVKENIRPKILVDVTGTLKMLPRITGVQRVVCTVLGLLLNKGVPGYDVCPVYMTDYGLRLAKEFMKSVYNLGDGIDKFFSYSKGDIFLGLDLDISIVDKERNFDELRNRKVKIYFFVYDLLPLEFPFYNEKGNAERFEKYLRFVSKYDGVITDSSYVANEYNKWRKNNFPIINDNFIVKWTHLGSDIKKNIRSKGIPKSAEEVFNAMSVRMTCLMVSTIEPRKGYRQTLRAFEYMWKNGLDYNLVIVGNPGWMMSDFIEKLHVHTELNNRLFWLSGISDEYLDELYKRTTGVIMASEGEGFGLAVIESAYYKKPLLCRDLPVFREIAGDNVLYFQDDSEVFFSEKIEKWFRMIEEKKAPDSGKIKRITWDECASNIIDAIL